MILVRHVPDDHGVHRVVLLGRLELDDAGAVAAIGGELPAGPAEVRFLLSKVWPGEPGAAGSLVDLARQLTRRDVEHRWVGALPEIAAALAGGGAALVAAGPDDVRAGAGWDGGLPYLRAPARSAVQPELS